MTDTHKGDDAALEKRRAREADCIESTLRAMAANYAGGHRWDFLDGEAVTIAADELTRLRGLLATNDASLVKDALEACDAIDNFPSNQGCVEGRITEKGDRELSNSVQTIREALAARGAGQGEAVKTEDIPALLRNAIVALERYEAPSRPAMLQLASHLRGVFEYPVDAEQAVRQCASIDTNGYVAEKAVIIAALRACRVASPPVGGAGGWLRPYGVTWEAGMEIDGPNAGEFIAHIHFADLGQCKDFIAAMVGRVPSETGEG